LNLLDDYPSQKVSLEMKGGGWTQTKVNQLRGKLRGNGMLGNRVMVHAFSLSVTGMAKKAGIPNRGYVVPSGDPLPSVSAVKAYGSNVSINYNDITAAKAAEYKAAGIKVWLWTMDTEAEFDEALAAGDVYAWVVDRLELAQDYLAEAG
jgi:hypothetical protein